MAQKKEEFKKFAAREPEVAILVDRPLRPDEAHRDNFDLDRLLGQMYDILRDYRTPTPIAMAIYGEWGIGKTTAMKWLHGLIDEWNASGRAERKIKIRPVWFYPWKYDNKEDVWRGLVSEVIINSIDVKGATTQIVKKAAKQFGLFLGRSFIHVLAGIKLKAKAPGDIAQAEIDLASIKEVLAEYQEAAHPEKAYLNEFESSLESWIKDNLGKDERMVIFIDDLDRCMPEIALKVLEALKLYLNVPNLVFVVGVNRDIILNLVKNHYEMLGLGGVEAWDYLAKMFQLEVQLGPTELQIKNFISQYLEEISYWKEPYLTSDEKTLFRGLFFDMTGRNPRRVKRMINSTLLSCAASVIDKTTGKSHGRIEFNQGLQLLFVRKILNERYTMGSLVAIERGNDFFRQWSQIVCEGRKEDKDFPCSVRIPKDFGKVTSEEGREIEGSLDAEVKKIGKKVQEVKSGLELVIEAGKYGEAYRPMLENPRFSGLFHLLGDEDLGELMRIPYPAEAEAAEIAAVVGTSKDEDIIREAIARQLGKKPDELTDEDYSKIEELDLRGSEISDLEPIKRLSSLQYLYINNTNVRDLDPIKGLSSLQRLSLSGTKISNLEPIIGLRIVKELKLRRTQVVDLEPIKGLGSLQKLSLSGTQVKDLEPIKELKSLEFLDFSETQVSNLEPLKRLSNLQGLWFSSTKVRDLEPIKGLSNLQRLYLSNTQVSNLEPIKGLSNLQRLWLSGTQVSDLEPIKGLSSLQQLGLINTQVSDIEPIKGLTNLSELHLWGTRVSYEKVVELQMALPKFDIYR